MKFDIPFSKLPKDLEDKYQYLHDYFPGKAIKVSPNCEDAEVELSWPTSEAFYVDPNLKIGLDWWDANMTVGEIPLAVKSAKWYQLSLNDNWTLWAWSKWLESSVKSPQETKKVVVLHIDDHTDCMPPLLFRKEADLYIDPLTGEDVNVSSPETVRKAIVSGAIAIGSFMPIFLHQFAELEVRHLLPPHRLNKASRVNCLHKTLTQDKLLGNAFNLRPGIEFVGDCLPGDLQYLRTADLNYFLAGIPSDASILLHVDMDYFNNRYDGDSAWRERPFVHDPDAQQVKGGVLEVFSRIVSDIPRNRIEDITIAISPGFFPAEFWHDSIDIINEVLAKQ